MFLSTAGALLCTLAARSFVLTLLIRRVSQISSQLTLFCARLCKTDIGCAYVLVFWIVHEVRIHCMGAILTHSRRRCVELLETRQPGRLNFLFSVQGSSSGSLSSHFSLSLSLVSLRFRHGHLGAGEAAVSVHGAGQSQPAGHRGGARQRQQSSGAGAEVPRQGQCGVAPLHRSPLPLTAAQSTRTAGGGLGVRQESGRRRPFSECTSASMEYFRDLLFVEN